jgi:hypothetical protein
MSNVAIPGWACQTIWSGLSGDLGETPIEVMVVEPQNEK